MPDDSLGQKIQAIKQELQEITNNPAASGVIGSGAASADLFVRQAELQKILDLYTSVRSLQAQIEQNTELASSDDPELAALAREELKGLEEQKSHDEQKLLEDIAQSSKKRFPSAIMEIRAGVGGEEAALFAGDLYRMYARYAVQKNWKISVVDESPSDLGGYKEITFTIKSPDAYDQLRYESGVHRIQRVPETEKSGRVHTSTATVMVLPEIPPKDLVISPNDLRVDVYRASGPGGQFVNKRESAVRLTHLPTGIVVTSQKMRTQTANKEFALDILRSRVYEYERGKEESALSSTRKEAIGSALRAEKIRTYNIPQDRVTDHRIGKTWHNIVGIFNGNIADMLEEVAANL
jgi:peptide chain release factor 1